MPTLYTRNAAALRDEAREKNLHCVPCGLEFDWDAPSRSRWAFSADHIIPKSLGGSDERSNLRPAHYGCNSARGNGKTRGLGSGNGVRQGSTNRQTPITPSASPHSERWP